jgi:plasmid maintenance system antidote protein VapI
MDYKIEIIKFLNKTGITQVTLAKKLGIDRSRLNRVLKNRGRFQPEDIPKLQHFFAGGFDAQIKRCI